MGILGGISFAALMTLFAVVLSQMFLVGWLAARVLPATAPNSFSSFRRSAGPASATC
jgi:hypothetical protein